MLARLWTLSGLLLITTPAQAAWTVKQKVDAKVGEKNATVAHTWFIDGDKFQLEVKNAADTTLYIFNGRTFYVCGKIDEAQLKAASVDPKVVDTYKGGACQVVPANFMARFFLSPLAAVQSVDASDGLKLTLAVKDYKATAAGPSASAAGHPCKGHERKYTVTKSGDGDTLSGAALTTSATETLCVTDELKWRQSLWNEVQKTVLRQPGGVALMGQLKGDLSSVSGFALSGEISQTMTDKGGKALNGSYTLSTDAVTAGDVDAEKFKIPPGYKVFSPESVELAKLADAPGIKAGAKEASPTDMVGSVMFCAIAGWLGCLAK